MLLWYFSLCLILSPISFIFQRSFLLQYFIAWCSFIQECLFPKFFSYISLFHWKQPLCYISRKSSPALALSCILEPYVFVFWYHDTFFPFSKYQLYDMLMDLKFRGICLIQYQLAFVMTTVMTKKIYSCTFHLHWKHNIQVIVPDTLYWLTGMCIY